MIVPCPNCGKKYQFDELKFKEIGITKGIFACKKCYYPIPIPEVFNQSSKSSQPTNVSSLPTNIQPEYSGKRMFTHRILKMNFHLSLRTKMMLLFVVVPLILFSTASALFLQRLFTLSELITEVSAKVVINSGERVISEIARSVAREIKLYLKAHPAIAREDFYRNPDFKKMALRKVGHSGYTVVLSKAIDTTPSFLWVHPQEKLIGMDITKITENRSSEDYQVLSDIIEKAFKTNDESDGYYRWQDNREKYMVIVPVKGTDLFVMSTTYIDEFAQPVQNLQRQADALTKATLGSMIIVLIFIILTIGLTAIFYGNSVSRKILNLSAAADRISFGDLSTTIPIESKDEIGTLAKAIQRMQVSLKISVDKLINREN